MLTADLLPLNVTLAQLTLESVEAEQTLIVSPLANVSNLHIGSLTLVPCHKGASVQHVHVSRAAIVFRCRRVRGPLEVMAALSCCVRGWSASRA
ncbi:hypothetical protein [Streptomyces shenzhenensis]|uniref:hypothetical protein n=1 Tax=Streptomyces shenzhenensis TaxID=943815 RepID=UPI0033DB36DB